MPYVISTTVNPEKTSEDPYVTMWTIQINYFDQEPGRDHYHVISIYAETLDLCLLRAKTLCNILNETKFEEAVATLRGLQDAKNNR